MSFAVAQDIPLFDDSSAEDGDNISDVMLAHFRDRYGSRISKGDIWEYLYGVMHAPDWRDRYRHDLQRNLPRVPLAPDFDAFRSAGRALMDLHIGFETGAELPIPCLVNEEPSEGQHPADAYRIRNQMRWGKKGGEGDRSVLHVNDQCRLIEIPSVCHDYLVSDRSPLEWAVASLKFRREQGSGVVDDPNRWSVWADEPFELIRHLRRLAYLSERSAAIISMLPQSCSGIDAGLAFEARQAQT